MYSKYNNLSDREKKLIHVAAILIIIFSLYIIKIYVPNLFSPSLGSQVEADAKKFDQLIPKIVKLNQLKKQAPKYTNIPGDDLFKYINQHPPKVEVLNEDAIVLQDLGAGKKVSVKYQTVGFDAFLQWLHDLHNQYGVVVEEINLIPDQKIGYVAVTATLSLPT